MSANAGARSANTWDARVPPPVRDCTTAVSVFRYCAMVRRRRNASGGVAVVSHTNGRSVRPLLAGGPEVAVPLCAALVAPLATMTPLEPTDDDPCTTVPDVVPSALELLVVVVWPGRGTPGPSAPSSSQAASGHATMMTAWCSSL